MPFLKEFRSLFSKITAGVRLPPSKNAELREFASLCRRLRKVQAKYSFDRLERRGKNWFVIYHCGNNSYRWQMPDEATAKSVENYGKNGGGISFARRRAIRSYRKDENGKWKLLRNKNTKKWARQRKEVTLKKREKAKRRRKRLKALELKRLQELERLEQLEQQLAEEPEQDLEQLEQQDPEQQELEQ